MIEAGTFIVADPRDVAPQLADAVHLWRLPWRRGQGRIALLALLADYLRVDPSTLELEAGAHGKPRLRGAHGLHFNWSHSGEFAVVALAREFELGVDIEQPRADVRVLELAERFFAPAEASALAACAESQRGEAFYQLWSAKEAVVKALGRGLAFGLERVEFARVKTDWHPSRFDAEAGAPAEWQIRPLHVASDYAGALAWRGPSRPVHSWTPSPRSE